MTTILSWKTIVAGALLVSIASLFDMYATSAQIKILRGLHTCKVNHASLSADSLTKALREHAKSNHPDIGAASACSVEDTNEVRALVRKHGGVGWLAWALFKVGVAPGKVETAVMVGLIATGSLCMVGLRRLPARYTRVFVALGLIQQGETAASTERRLMKKLKHGEYTYGNPPCSTHCGDVPSQCSVDGWMYADVSYVNHT